MGSTHFLTKTLKNVRTEMSLIVLAYNMKRMIKMMGVPALLGVLVTELQKVPLSKRLIMLHNLRLHLQKWRICAGL